MIALHLLLSPFPPRVTMCVRILKVWGEETGFTCCNVAFQTQFNIEHNSSLHYPGDTAITILRNIINNSLWWIIWEPLS